MIEEYNSLKTAIHRIRPSKPYQILISKGLINKNVKVIDYGCGYGYDVKYYSYLGYNIIGYDKYNKEYNNINLNNKYDILTCNYVFNVLPYKKDINKLLKDIKNLSDNIYISVRADKKVVKDNWKYDKINNGYWTSKGTFQRFYDEEMIKNQFGEVEYIINGNEFKLFKLNK